MSSHEQEILGPAISSQDEAGPIIAVAIQHFREAKRATIQVMADLRRLEDGQVHLLYGYKNFAKWAEDTFDGIGGVRQLTRAGAVALELDRRNLIDLDNPKGVGTTALRELSVIGNTYGEDKMAEVFITARGMLSGKDEVSSTTVEAAMRVLMPPAKPEAIAMIEVGEREAEAEIEDEPQTEFNSKEQELIEHIRDLSYDLPESLADLANAVEQLANHRKGEDVAENQTWIEGSR
jgi:hypothetical protein